MVFLHGGGFAKGNIKDYNPTPLVSKGVVVVTVQYRLGIYGQLIICTVHVFSPCLF